MPDWRNQQPVWVRRDACGKAAKYLLYAVAVYDVVQMIRVHNLFAGAAFVAQVAFCAAAEMPSGIFHGKLATIVGNFAAGTIDAVDTAGAVFSCGYDTRSYFEFNKERVAATKLQPGDPLEIVADRKPGTRACYARIIHVVAGPAPAHRVTQTAERPSRQSSYLPPRGDRNLAGVVLRIDSSMLTLKTRDGESTLLVRPDTRFLGDGVRVGVADIPRNTHVSVRAGRDAYGRIEAYQVMWGQIVNAP